MKKRANPDLIYSLDTLHLTDTTDPETLREYRAYLTT